MTGMDAAMQAMFVLTAVRFMLASARRQLATLCGSLDATLYEVLETGSRGRPRPDDSAHRRCGKRATACRRFLA
jgi:hypothetical protein